MLKLNENKKHVENVRNAIINNGGYCPCSIIKNDDTKCMCKDFKDKMMDPNFNGYCHCGLYYFENT